MDCMSENRATQPARRWGRIAAGWVASLVLGLGSALAQPATTGNLALPGEIDEYQFDLSQRTLLHFDPQAAGDTLNWNLSGPFGAIGSTRSFVGSDNFAGTFAATTTSLAKACSTSATTPWRLAAAGRSLQGLST